jgi:hypothetical protein
MNDTPTPKTNALLGKILYDCGVLDEDTAPEEWVILARTLESELAEARAIIAAALKALPVGYLPAHTPESIPARIEDLCKTIVDADRELVEAQEQRDTLAEALRNIRDGYGGQAAAPDCCEDCDFLIPIDAALATLKRTL